MENLETDINSYSTTPQEFSLKYLHLLAVFVVVCQQEIEMVEYHPLKTASALILASSECTWYLKANATGLSATKATVLWRSKCYPFSTFLPET